MTIDLLYLPRGFYYAIAALSCFSSIISCFGSCTIVYLILKYRRYRTSIFQRLMLGLAMCDLVTSASFAIAVFSVPRDTGLPLAIGNKFTCHATAWLILQGFGSFYYSGALGLYFLLMIRFGKSETYTSRRLEPWVHMVPWLFPLATNIASSFTLSVNVDPILLICTHGCRRGEGCTTTQERELPYATDPVAFIPFPLGVASIIWTWMVYRFVHRQQSMSQRHGTVAFIHSKAVAVQAACYTCANLNSLVVIAMVATALPLAGDVTTLSERSEFGFFVLILGVLFPMQGFLNWITYCRPPYCQWRRASPERSKWWAYCKVLSGENPVLSSDRPTNSTIGGPNSILQISSGSPRSTISTRLESPPLSIIEEGDESDNTVDNLDRLGDIDDVAENALRVEGSRPTLGPA